MLKVSEPRMRNLPVRQRDGYEQLQQHTMSLKPLSSENMGDALLKEMRLLL